MVVFLISWVRLEAQERLLKLYSSLRGAAGAQTESPGPRLDFRLRRGEDCEDEKIQHIKKNKRRVLLTATLCQTVFETWQLLGHSWNLVDLRSSSIRWFGGLRVAESTWIKMDAPWACTPGQTLSASHEA